jgi:hypothetical protein
VLSFSLRFSNASSGSAAKTSSDFKWDKLTFDSFEDIMYFYDPNKEIKDATVAKRIPLTAINITHHQSSITLKRQHWDSKDKSPVTIINCLGSMNSEQIYPQRRKDDHRKSINMVFR